MAAIANPLVSVGDPRFQALPGYTLKPSTKSLAIRHPLSLSLSPICHRKAGIASYRGQFVVKNAYRDGGRPSSASIFIGGFVLGGITVGALACVYASQISEALTGTNKKELLRKLPKFIYDEEKALEKNRKILSEKIAQINASLDNVSSQLHGPKKVDAASDVSEAAM